MILHPVAEVLAGQHQRGDVGVQHLLEILGVDLIGPHLLVDALGIDQNVAATQALSTGDNLQALLDELLVTGVAGHVHDLDTGSSLGLDALHGSLQLLLTTGRDADGAAVGSVALGDSLAEAAGAAEDHCLLASDIKHLGQIARIHFRHKKDSFSYIYSVPSPRTADETGEKIRPEGAAGRPACR